MQGVGVGERKEEEEEGPKQGWRRRGGCMLYNQAAQKPLELWVTRVR